MMNEITTLAQPVPVRKRIAYSTHQLGSNLLWNAFNTVAVYYYVTELHVSGVILSASLIAYGLINAALNLLAGHISDRTNTRWGRRLPFIIGGALPFCVTFYFIFAPPALGPQGLLIYFLVLTFIFDLCFTVTALNFGSLFPEMYQEKRTRLYVGALLQLFAILGLMVGVALSKSLGQTLGWQTMALVFAGIGVVSLYVSVYGSFENPAYREQSFSFREAVTSTFRNPRFIPYVVANFLIQFSTTLFTTVSAFYTKYVVSLNALENTLFLGSIFIVAIPMSFLWARIATRISTIRAAMISTLLYLLITLAFLFETNSTSVIITGAFLGIPIAGFLVLLNILLADVIDYDAELTGRRREGMYLGMNGFIVRLGLSLQYAVMAIFFVVSGYDEHLKEQHANTILGFRILLGGLPIGFLLIAIVMLRSYQSRLKPTQIMIEPAIMPAD
ncbi:sugar transporter [Ktedonobacter sp. SOSP1-85]|uniref:MFS transporter n=1 Tax=Ktedonobacter sp. SOSP1-85 TaxID=2778367 RepID=UPI001A2FE4B0|nr:MFS transporter [Ktedonobacter sp. SOSP1-85]GHO80293.1 sugar transporter [Ktedonobacter sp. SOSP1-85]